MFAVSTGQRLYKLPNGGDSSGDESDAASVSQQTELEAAMLLYRGSFS